MFCLSVSSCCCCRGRYILYNSLAEHILHHIIIVTLNYISLWLLAWFYNVGAPWELTDIVSFQSVRRPIKLTNNIFKKSQWQTPMCDKWTFHAFISTDKCPVSLVSQWRTPAKNHGDSHRGVTRCKAEVTSGVVRKTQERMHSLSFQVILMPSQERLKF